MRRLLKTSLGPLVVAVTTWSCLYDDIVVEGAPCPCPDGFDCNEATQRCVAALDGGACTPTFVPTNVEVVGRTAHCFVFQWQAPTGADDRFQAYQIRLAPAGGAGEQRVVTSQENPDLALLKRPYTGGDDYVERTLVCGLPSSTLFDAYFVARDASGCDWISPLLTPSTSLEPQRSIVIYDDTTPGNTRGFYEMGQELTDASQAHTGSTYASFVGPACPGGMTSCGNNVAIANVDASLAPLGADLDNKGAFLSFAISFDGPTHIYARAYLITSDGADHRLEPFALRSSPDYQIVEIPLEALASGAGPLTTSSVITRFNYGSSPLAPGTQIRIDDVAIRW